MSGLAGVMPASARSANRCFDSKGEKCKPGLH
jgi:hypothetical protein